MMTATAPRYALYPGFVRSQTDGDRHYIGALTLAHLYGVRVQDCIVINPNDADDPSQREKLERARRLVPLVPRYDGNYTLPLARAA
jgi:hypothetical protein